MMNSYIYRSGPSQTYPQLAYRNPLDQLVAFLDSKHGENWAIWEFRAEGTGYPDDAVYGRVRHYPWPDHHPPPFRLVPLIMASMRNWLHGGELNGPNPVRAPQEGSRLAVTSSRTDSPTISKRSEKRVVVVHCKAGKGRSGTASCSYLISEEGWKAEDALARFTERRMRPSFGAGVSIPSQLRWVSYVDRWTKSGKEYVDRPIEILEIHTWGLRNGVKMDVEGFIEDGKKIKVFHTFTKKERVIVEGGVPADGGFSEMMWEMAGFPGNAYNVPDQVELADGANPSDQRPNQHTALPDVPEKKRHALIRKGTGLAQKASAKIGSGVEKAKTMSTTASADSSTADVSKEAPDEQEPGGMAVIFRPTEPIRLPNSDVNIAVERRNKTHKSFNLTMVSAVAHVWFNAFFESQDTEKEVQVNDSGTFSIEWEAMDGIKGSSRKGSRALDRLTVVWRFAETGTGQQGEEINEPGEGEPVRQFEPADWKGVSTDGTDGNKVESDLGLRVQSPASTDVSRASSLRSAEEQTADDKAEGEVLTGVRSAGPSGEDLVHEDGDKTKQ